MAWSPRRIESWGRLSQVDSIVAAPGTDAEAVLAMQHAPRATFLPLGAARSYGDQPFDSAGAALSTASLDRVVSFDPGSAELVAEAGVTLRQLLQRFLPQGFIAPVSPGTGFVTLGGCVANDVHGKNHEALGSFGSHVQWFDLVLPSGELRRVCRADEPLFSATIGGMGLTGLVVRVGMKLMRVPSNAVDLREERVSDLDEFIERFEAVRSKSSYSVGWIDALASGTRLGRGILETAEHSAEGVAERAPARWNLPFEFPGFALNSIGVQAFNELYYRRVPTAGRQRRLHVRKFLYPLDAIGHWNRMYGRRGFFQFQCVVPDEQAPRGLRRLLEAVSAGRASSFLAVLKTLGGSGPGMLSFPMRGYTLALDLPNHGAVRGLLSRLEALTLDHGGRIYLAKDAALSEQGFKRMYPRFEEFRRTLEHGDPQGRLMSDMARRLRLRDCTSGLVGAHDARSPVVVRGSMQRSVQGGEPIEPKPYLERH